MWRRRRCHFDAAGSQFSIVIGNPNEDYPALVEVFVLEEGVEVPLTLSSAGTPLDLSPIEPGTLQVLNVPRRDIDGSGIFAKAFRLEAGPRDGNPVQSPGQYHRGLFQRRFSPVTE